MSIPASQHRQKTHRMNKKHLITERTIAPYYFVAPFLVFYIVFLVFPIIFNVYVSFTDWNAFGKANFIGIDNYIELLSDSRFFMSLGNTGILMLMITPIQMVLGMLIAVVLSQKYFPFPNAFRLANFLPYLTTPVALGIFFAMLFDTHFGYVNKMLELIGITGPDWFGKVWPARFLTAILAVWRWSGYTAVMFMAGITNISDTIYEAADIDGTNVWQSFWYITLPLLKDVAVFVIITNMIGCFQLFEEPVMLFTGSGMGSHSIGGPRNAVLTGLWMMYDTSFGTVMRYGYGSAISVGLFVIIGVVTIVFKKIVGKEEY